MQMHQELQVSERQLCEAAHLEYRRYLRWKRRCAEGKPPVEEPGPGPAEPLDFDAVWERVRNLHHARQRTQGTGALYEQLRGCISRRKLRNLVRHARREQRREQDAGQWRLEWAAIACKVWATDTTEVVLGDGTRLWFQTIRDLGSRYTIGPFALHTPTGSDIARWLEDTFQRFGVPLFLRMDNAANQNCPEVMAVLAKYWVIPYNSPPRYPQFNGGCERAQIEVQEEIEDWTAGLDQVPAEHLDAYAALAVHELNHKPRPLLGGRHACQVFAPDARHATLTLGQRKEILDELIAAAAVLLEQDDARNSHHADRAWRHAVQGWLESHAVIRVVQTPSVNQLPPQTCDISCVA